MTHPSLPSPDQDSGVAIREGSWWFALAAILAVVVTVIAMLGVLHAEQSDVTGVDCSTGTPCTSLGTAGRSPMLTEAQRLKLISLSQEVEIHRLRLQIATQALQDAVAAVQVPGYRLNEQLEYVPVSPAGAAGE